MGSGSWLTGAAAQSFAHRMLKWLLTLLVALVVLTALSPWLARFGLGRLPGDMVVRYRGRAFYIPFTSTVILSLLLTLIARFV